MKVAQISKPGGDFQIVEREIPEPGGGVRVRLLVDDLFTAGADPLFAGLAAFPNVEVRLFSTSVR